MLYLVTGEWVEVGALLSPEQVVSILDQTVLPSLERLAQSEEAGRIRGGIFPGERAGAWVMEADSSEEVGQFLASLPFWGQVKWYVRALQTMRSSVEREQGVREQLQAASRQAASQSL